MKKLSLILLSASIIFSISSCNNEGPIGPVGPPGPPGPQGPQGEQGAPGETGYVFETGVFDFTASNDYLVTLAYPEGFEVLDTDAVLVYLLWGNVEGTDIWKPLPYSVFTDFGIHQYSYDYTIFDIQLALDANFNRDGLGANWTDGWIARVVIVPANFIEGRVDMSDYYEVEEFLKLKHMERNPGLEIINRQ